MSTRARDQPGPDAAHDTAGPLERSGAKVEVGRTLGRYVVLGRLGAGAMGEVFKAYDESLDRAIALKLLRGETSERHAQRLMREAQALARLSHANVVQVYEVGKADGRWFIAMELVDGQSLRQWQQGARSWRESLEVYLGAGEGLAAAHEAGLVHRDFKPDNCLIDERGVPRVVDFGLAQHAHDATPSGDLTASAPARLEPRGAAALTRTGAVLGTPAYMPLEQLDGRRADARSDQFSFCVSLYEAIYGERPFVGDTVGRLTLSLVEGEIRPAPKGIRVPARLRRALLRGLCTEPGDRWPTMRALLDELRSVATPVRLGRPALALLGAGVLGALLWPRPTPVQPCQGGPALLDGVWDETRREAVEAAILGTGLSFAPETWARVEPQLDTYATGWADKHREVCEATSVRREQSAEVMDLRMACLDRRRIALRQAVGVLAEANAQRVERAMDLVSGLGSLSRCDDVQVLREATPRPEDPVVARQVTAQFEQLARVTSLDAAGEYERALEEVAAMIDPVEALSHGPLTAEVLQARGLLRERLGHYDDAREDLERAYLLAIEHGHVEMQVRAAFLLASVLGYRLARPEPGIRWGRIALAHAKRSQDPAFGPVKALQVMGLIHFQQGRLDEALDHHRRALEVQRDSLDPDDPAVAGSMLMVGSVLRERGDHVEALEVCRDALELRERVLGLRHPDVARALNLTGNALFSLGRLDEALALYQRALDIWEQALGPRHIEVGSSLHNVGNALTGLGRRDEAIEHLERSLSIKEEVLGADHRSVANALTALAFALSGQGKPQKALGLHHRARRIWEQTHGPSHPLVAMALSNIGRVLIELDRLDEALDYLERAQAMREQVLPGHHPHLAWSLIGLAEIALRRDDPTTARDHARRAVEIRESDEVPSTERAEARFLLARTLWPDPTRRAEAIELAEQARDAWAEAGPAAREDLERVRAWLAAHANG